MANLRGLPIETRLIRQSTEDNETGCWNWDGSKDKDGYGYIKMDGKTTKAHRASFIVANGPVPEGLWVLHTCDNPSCINPQHLYAGTPMENMQDRKDRGRDTGWSRDNSGERNPRAVLTPDDVSYIRKHWVWGRGPEFAKRFGVSVVQITRVRRGAAYK
jgi:hypothetical protein